MLTTRKQQEKKLKELIERMDWLENHLQEQAQSAVAMEVVKQTARLEQTFKLIDSMLTSAQKKKIFDVLDNADEEGHYQ